MTFYFVTKKENTALWNETKTHMNTLAVYPYLKGARIKAKELDYKIVKVKIEEMKQAKEGR